MNHIPRRDPESGNRLDEYAIPTWTEVGTTLNLEVSLNERRKLNKREATTLALMLLSTPVLAGDFVNASGASHVAISGYDPVAFFNDAMPVNGSPSVIATYQGATYFFATEEHKSLFTLNPDKYAPQYCGFCAYGVALDALFPVDISTWQIRNGNLYLNLNHAILKKFNAEFDGNVAKADKNWPGLVQTNGRKQTQALHTTMATRGAPFHHSAERKPS